MSHGPDPSVSLRHELVFHRTLRHPPSAVWQAITDPERLSAWWPFPATEATVTEGGSIVFDDGEGTVVRARITHLIDGRVLEFIEEETDVIRFELEEADGGTHLTFTHRFDRGPDPARPAAGWHQALDALSSVLANKEPTWLEDSSDLVAAYTSRFGQT
jgi:uncharacterized protein YndB with AHSA1/START domain